MLKMKELGPPLENFILARRSGADPPGPRVPLPCAQVPNAAASGQNAIEPLAGRGGDGVYQSVIGLVVLSRHG